MTHILHKLNIGHYAGNLTWKPIIEYTTEHGEIGLYKSDGDGVASETVMQFILVGDKMLPRMYSKHILDVAKKDTAHIAQFAGATKVKEA